MKSKDENQTKVKHDKEVDSKRKKFLNKVAMATAFVGVTGIGIQNLPEVKEVSAMMKVPTTRPQSPSLKPGGMFAGSTGGFRPVSPSVGIGKNPISSPIKNPVNNSTIKNPVTSSTNKPNNGTSTIKPGNTGNLVNKFENMNSGSGNTPISTKPPSTSTNKPITAPPKPNTGTGTGTTTAPPKPNTGTQSKPQTGNTTTGSTNGLSQNKPGGNTNLDSGKKPVITTQTNQNGSKPGTSGTGQNTSKPGTSGSGNSAGASGSTAGKPGSGSLTSKPGGSTTGGTSQNGSKPGTSGTGQNISKPGGATNNTGKPNNRPSGSSSNSLAGDDTPTNTRRVSSTTTNNTTNNTTNTTQTGGKDRFGKIMGVIGLVSTVAFLGTSVAGILQGERSLEAQRELQEEAIKAQQQLAENQQREEYEKLAAQLGGTYDPDRGVIVLPDGSELNVVTGIVTHPDGSWVDQNGNLHLPDGSGTIDKDGNINIGGVGTIDKDGNLVLDDGSGYFDSDGNFHPSGEINQVKGVSGGVGFGGMYIDTQFGGMKVSNQSVNYGSKAYDKNAYDEALSKSQSHSSVEEGIFTAREYDAIVNLILSAKLNENIAKQMEKDGQLTSAQLEVVLKLLDSFNSSGKI